MSREHTQRPVANVADYGWTASTRAGTDDYLFPLVERIVRAERPGRVLDLGCGNGRLTRRLAAFTDAIGYDPDPGAITAARELGGATFTSEIPDGPFDCVVSTEVVEHVYDPHEWALHCAAALRPGGLLVCSTPYHGYLKNLAIALAGRFDRHWHPLRAGGHIKFWSRATLSALLDQHGFTDLGFHGVGRVPLLWRSMVLTGRS